MSIIGHNLRFVARNPRFAWARLDLLPAVIAAMKAYRAKHPACEWCGRKNPDVHHIHPVAMWPLRADDPENMICLCREPECHLVVGHCGDFKTGFNLDVREQCAMQGRTP